MIPLRFFLYFSFSSAYFPKCKPFKIKSPILMARIYCQYYLLGILTLWLIHSSFNSCVNFCKTVKFYLLNEFVEFLHTIYRRGCPFPIVYAFIPLSLINWPHMHILYIAIYSYLCIRFSLFWNVKIIFS